MKIISKKKVKLMNSINNKKLNLKKLKRLLNSEKKIIYIIINNSYWVIKNFYEIKSLFFW